MTDATDPCSVCGSRHLPGTLHVFSHINKVVTRPGCPQCQARDRVIDDLCQTIEHLNKRILDLENPSKPEFDHSAHMKKWWAEKKRTMNDQHGDRRASQTRKIEKP